MRDLSFLQMIKRDVSHIYVYLQSTLSKTIPKETFWRMGVLIFLIPSSKCHSNTLMRYKKLYQDKCKYLPLYVSLLENQISWQLKCIVVFSCLKLINMHSKVLSNLKIILQPLCTQFLSNNTFKMHIPYFCTINFITRKIFHSTLKFLFI